MSPSDAGRIGGRIAAERMTPEQRRLRASKACDASAVKRVLSRRPQLTPEQVALLRAEFGGR